ncbi:MAG: hypothetical protein KFH87_08850 [Bacteroidetes bacterium]|nr:hypothetical protein [Bacteroidota bacterium]
MKRFTYFFILVFAISFVAHSQYRGEEPGRPSVSEGVYQSSGNNNILGFFNPDNLDMRHSFSVSYGSIGGEGLGMSMYTNSLRYRISDPLSVRADVAMLFSPFGSHTSGFHQDVSGIFLRRASIDYQPSSDMRISLQFRNEPYSLYNPYGSRGFGMSSLFFDTWDDDLR